MQAYEVKSVCCKGYIQPVQLAYCFSSAVHAFFGIGNDLERLLDRWDVPAANRMQVHHPDIPRFVHIAVVANEVTRCWIHKSLHLSRCLSNTCPRVKLLHWKPFVEDKDKMWQRCVLLIAQNCCKPDIYFKIKIQPPGCPNYFKWVSSLQNFESLRPCGTVTDGQVPYSLSLSLSRLFVFAKFLPWSMFLFVEEFFSCCIFLLIYLFGFLPSPVSQLTFCLNNFVWSCRCPCWHLRGKTRSKSDGSRFLQA